MDEYVVLDIETTGLSRYRHRITEIGAVKVKDNSVVEEFQTLVNPKQRIPRFITNLTGITNEMVKDAQPIQKVLPSFLDFMGDNVMVAHNATFDYGFLHHNLQKHLAMNFENGKLCTRKLANRLLPELPSKKLECVCERLNVANHHQHRAMGDVHATSQVFSQFLSMLNKQGINGKENIMKFERSPRRILWRKPLI